MQKATDTSLAITEGKVTELTPLPVPEAFAAAYQAEGNLEKAQYYYKLALDGIHAFIIRHKTDAIVLNACLVAGQMDKKEALGIAFDHSPFFRDTQLNVLVGPGCSLLVQQCETRSTEWALQVFQRHKRDYSSTPRIKKRALTILSQGNLNNQKTNASLRQQ
eukprot:scaffold9305_cov267-Chaetoceros_neogracile.AAC.2